MTRIGGKDLEEIAKLTLLAQHEATKVHRADPVTRYKTNKHGEREQVSQHDLFKCFDLIALEPHQVRMVQTTTPSGAGQRKIKISENKPWPSVTVELWVWDPDGDVFEVFEFQGSAWLDPRTVEPLKGFQTALAIHQGEG